MTIKLEPTFVDVATQERVQIIVKNTDDPHFQAGYWRERAKAAEERVQDKHDAMRCACDWLRMGAPGKALEVLEANL